MPAITIYNDSDEDLDAGFDVVEVMAGKEIKRKTMEPDKGDPQGFRLYASNQAFVILPRGTKLPKITGMAKGVQIDAKPRRRRR